MGEFIEYIKRKPKEIKEYLCRYQHPLTWEWSSEYLQNSKKGLMIKEPSDNYYNLQWYEESDNKEDVVSAEEVSKKIDSEILCNEYLKNAFELSSFKYQEVLRLEMAFIQGAEVMRNTFLQDMHEYRNQKEDEALTIGKIVRYAMKLHELNAFILDAKFKLPSGTISKLVNDEIYTNSIPILLFRDLILSLHIPFSKIESAMLPTFKVVLSKETEETIRRKPYHYLLFENEESTIKYLNRLKEIL